MTETPLVTIGISCYNAEDTIARAINSALSQNWPNTEIVIVDDVSSDGSVEIVRQTILAHPNARLIQHEENKGPAGARQTIIDNATGTFICFIDDDDEALPERVSTQYQRIINYEKDTGVSLTACYASGTRHYSNDYKMPLVSIGSQGDIPNGVSVADRILFFGGNDNHFFGGGNPSCSLMARKSTFEQVGGFDESFRRVEDMDFAIRLALKEGHFIGCPENLFIQHSTEAADKAPEKNLEAEQKLAQKHKEYLDTIGMFYYAYNWPLVRYYHFKGDYTKMAKTLISLGLRYPIKTTSHFLTTAPKRFFH